MEILNKKRENIRKSVQFLCTPMVSKREFMVLVSSLEVCCIHCSVQGFYRGLKGSPRTFFFGEEYPTMQLCCPNGSVTSLEYRGRSTKCMWPC